MSYLLRTKDYFILIENKARQGLFYQTYTKDGYSKPSLIHSYPTEHYYAMLDAAGSLHVITESHKNQMLYITFNKGMPSKKVILEDPGQNYDFKHVQLYTLNDTLFLLYSVKHPTGSGRSLMYQPLNPSAVEIATLLPHLPDTTVLKTLSTGDKLYLIYTDFTDQYELKLTTLDLAGAHHTVLYTSRLPIIDFNCCLCDNILHILYIKDAYGKQQISYMNTQNTQEILLDLPNQKIAPALFNYYGQLWMTYPYGDRLLMRLSSDQGHTFSVAVPTSLRGLYTAVTYQGVDKFALSCTALYASLNATIRLGVIGAIDLVGIHPDVTQASELELLLEGLAVKDVPIAPTPLVPPSALTALTPITFEDALAQPPDTVDLKAAARAFMDATNGFEAQPKN